VVAPSLIPKKPGERVKTNRRDAVTLARLLRAGELTSVWVPDAVHEAVRDLVRARQAAAEDFRKKRQQLLSFLLRHGRIFMGHNHWTQAHRRWLAGQKFERPAQQTVFQDAIDAIDDATTRAQRLEEQLALIVPSWSMAPVVAAYQAMRGVSFVVAVTFAAEIGDVRRFDNARQVNTEGGIQPADKSLITVVSSAPSPALCSKRPQSHPRPRDLASVGSCGCQSHLTSDIRVPLHRGSPQFVGERERNPAAPRHFRSGIKQQRKWRPGSSASDPSFRRLRQRSRRDRSPDRRIALSAASSIAQ
jgi:hypothetical protein